MNRDVLLMIYEIVHRDLTKQLIAEYCKKLRRCTICNNVCICNITIKCDAGFYKKAYNYRIIGYEWSYKYNCVYTKNNQYCCDLSKNYY